MHVHPLSLTPTHTQLLSCLYLFHTHTHTQPSKAIETAVQGDQRPEIED